MTKPADARRGSPSASTAPPAPLTAFTTTGFVGPDWLDTRWWPIAVLLIGLVPLLWPADPPLVDWPGHVGRYRIMAEAGMAPLSAFYAVRWGVIGNVGVDGLVMALHPLLDVEGAARLVTTLIAPATMLAMVWVAREAHGRTPPATGFALPLAWGYPFQLGFINFCLSAALALAGLALWLRLARRWPVPARTALFVPIAALVWLCHSFGWAMLGVFVLGAEWQARRATAASSWSAAWRTALVVAPLALPLLLSIAGHERLSGDTGDWFDWPAKAQWIAGLLRERWKIWDVAAAIAIALVLWAAVRSPRLSFVGVLAVPALFGAAAFALLPRLFQGGAGVDMRILPYAAALALLAIRSDDARVARRLATAGLAFVVARTIGTTIAFALFANGQQQALRAVAAMPPGSAVLVLVDQPDGGEWSDPRLAHIDGLAIARARVFTNGQWALPGQQLVHPLHGAPYDRDPSQLVYPPAATYRTTDLAAAIRGFDRCVFDLVWLIDFPPDAARSPDLTLRWHDRRSALYRVRPARCRPAVGRVGQREGDPARDPA